MVVQREFWSKDSAWSTARQLAKWHGVTLREVQRWVEDGLPHETKRNPRGGKRVWVFNNEHAVLPWLAGKNIITPTMETKALEKARASGKRSKRRPPAATAGAGTGTGILAALDRLKDQEAALGERLAKAERNPEYKAAEIAALQRLHIRLVAEVRQTEIAALEYRKRIGELVDLSTVRQAFDRCAVATKNSLMGIWNALSVQIRPLLSDPEKAQTVGAMIDEAVRAALRHLNEIPVQAQASRSAQAPSKSAP